MSFKPIPVVDLFAGPGGLGEGFSRVEDEKKRKVFQTVISIEKDPNAIDTLRLRSFYRSWVRSGRDLPPAYLKVLSAEGAKAKLSAISEIKKLREWDEAQFEACLMILGKNQRKKIHTEIGKRLAGAKTWVLIGGPPCQAYSLVGRSRMRNHDGLKADHRHFLYKEYLKIIQKFKPKIFVMENVKGLNTAKVNGEKILPKILEDLRTAVIGGYTLHSLESGRAGMSALPDDFLIKSEKYGVPQTRHRVIIVGVRKDFGVIPRPLAVKKLVSVANAIGDLPGLKGLSSARARHKYDPKERGQPRIMGKKNLRNRLPNKLADFMHPLSSLLWDSVLNHEARSHMESDLLRYSWWASNVRSGRSPNITDLLAAGRDDLLPCHANLKDLARGKASVFLDRFKVQVAKKPSGTVTSHISKDGHYYIHYNSKQARSFSVREAARIQTFPDDYFFMGNRTQQYHQVGNAVPPYLAYQIAQRVWEALRG